MYEKEVSLVQPNRMSPFLEDIQHTMKMKELFWSDYPPVTGTIKRLTVRVGNQQGRGEQPTVAIKDYLKAQYYRWTTSAWSAWCRTYPAHSFSIDRLKDEALWSAAADGIEVQSSDESDSLLARYLVNLGQRIPIFDHIYDKVSREYFKRRSLNGDLTV